MRSALFVDFDNVFTGLRRLSPAYADTFARQPGRWMSWLTETLAKPASADAGVLRRILVRRCYLNPVVYRNYRIGFSRAGFEIIDCPPMTTAGKTSTDIHMVLDMIDVLQANTRYDEFIVFSADADFTPVLRKLRREDRRTTIFAAGATSASYDASADLSIDPEAFIHEALGFSEEETSASVPGLDSLNAQAEKVVWALIDAADQPVQLPALTKALATRIPELPVTDWAGKGTFIAFLKSLALEPLRIDKELNALLDPRRLSKSAAAAGPARTTPATPPLKTAATEGPPVSEQLGKLVSQQVAAASRPVPASLLAQLVREKFPGIESNWLGHGSWKKLLESLSLAKVEIVWHQQVGWALDPQRHTLDLPSESGERPAGSSSDANTVLVSRLLDVVGLPALDPAKYRAQLEGLSYALDFKPYSLSMVTKSMRDRCQDKDQAVSREQCQRLLRTLIFNGFDPENPAHGFEELVAFACDVIVSANMREGVQVTEGDRKALSGWLANQSA